MARSVLLGGLGWSVVVDESAARWSQIYCGGSPVGSQEVGCLCDRMSKFRNDGDLAKLDQDGAIAKYVLFENRSA